jgi:hypothetical protein
VAGRGQLGGGPDGGIRPSFGRPLASRIRQSLALTPAGALVTMTVGKDVVLEKANGLTCIEGSSACISIGDEASGWTLSGGSRNPDKLRGRICCWSGRGVAAKVVGAEASSAL